MKSTAPILLFCLLFLINPFINFAQKSELTAIEKKLADSLGFDTWVTDEIKRRTDSVLKPTKVKDWRDPNNLDLNKVSLKFCVTAEKGQEILTELGESFWKKGYLIVATQHETNPLANEIYVIKSTNQFVVLGIKGTNAVNYGKGPDWVLEFVQDINTRYPFRIIKVDADLIIAEFTMPPTDWLSFAKELYTDCPDIVEQRAGSVEDLAVEMQKTNQLFLWWD